MQKTIFGLDSQCYTYLISAWASIQEPDLNDPLRVEKISLVRMYFYFNPLYVCPMIKEEYLKIKDEDKLKMHESWDVVFPTFSTELDRSQIDVLACHYNTFHSDLDDCKVVAEYEGINILLSYDFDLIKHLGTKTKNVRIVKPSEHWASIKVTKNIKPNVIPHETNPLSLQSWWKAV